MDNSVLKLTADLLSAYVANNTISPEELPKLVEATCAAFVSACDSKAVNRSKQQPAVPVRSSLSNEYLICLEDGKKLKSLTRYIRTRYNLSPDEYREKWGLPKTYPMVAPEYAQMRSSVAKRSGLGRINRAGRAKEAS